MIMYDSCSNSNKVSYSFFLLQVHRSCHIIDSDTRCALPEVEEQPTCARAQRTWARQSVHARGRVRARLLPTKVQKLVESKNLQALVM